MGWIVSGILLAIIELGVSGTQKVIGWMSDLFQVLFGANPAMFENAFPVVKSFNAAFIATAGALVIVFFILGVFRNMFTGLGFMGEKPFQMVIRTLIAIALIFLLKPGMELIYYGREVTVATGNTVYNEGIFHAIYKAFGDVTLEGYQAIGNTEFHLGGVLGSFALGGTTATLIYGTVLFVFLVAILINMLKLFLEMIERYVLLNVLIFFSPLAASAVTLESTMKVFSSYLKMFFGQMMMLLMNVVTMKIIESGIAEVFKAMNGVQSSELLKLIDKGFLGAERETLSFFTPFILLMLILAFLKVAQRFDNYARDIGMTVGITGGSLLEEIIAGGKAVSGMYRGLAGGGSGGKGGSGSGSSGGGLLGMFGAKSGASGGITGILGATAGAARTAFASRYTPGHELANKSFAAAFGASFLSRLGFAGNQNGVAARMASDATITQDSAVSMGSGRATRGLIKTLSGNMTSAGENGIGLKKGSLRSIQVGNGAVMGISKENGHLIAISNTKPAFMDSSVSTYKGPDGKEWYSQDLQIANEEFKSLPGNSNQVEYSGYTSAMHAYMDQSTSDFRGAMGGQTDVSHMTEFNSRVKKEALQKEKDAEWREKRNSRNNKHGYE